MTDQSEHPDGAEDVRAQLDVATLAEELVKIVPALRDLASLNRATIRVTQASGLVDFDMPTVVPMEVLERAYVLHVLERCGGNRTHTADLLEINASTLYRKLNRWGV